MKKKIALLLALIMTISLMPVTIFADSSNRITGSLYNINGEKTLLALDKTSHELKGYGAKPYNKEYTDKIENAPFLDLYVNDLNAVGNERDAFTLTLKNAVWALDLYNNSDNKVYQGSTLASGAGLSTELADVYTSYTKNQYTYVPTGDSKSDAKFGTIGYTLMINSNEPSIAEIYINDDYESGSRLRIPITAIVTSNDSVTIGMSNNNSAFTTTKEFIVVEGFTSGTNNYVKTTKSGRDKIALDPIIFAEQKPRAIQNGVFEIVAPRGYEFNNPDQWKFRIDSGLLWDTAELTDEDGDDISAKSYGYIPSDALDIQASNRANNTRYQYKESFYVKIDGFDGSRTRAGSLIIENVILYPINDIVNIGDELNVSITKYDNYKNTSDHKNAYGGTAVSNSGVSDGDILVAKVVDFNINFAAAAAKDLVSGQWDRTNESAVHASAKVTFEELEVDAWRSERITTFTLPEEVQIKGIKFNTRTNVATNSADNYYGIDSGSYVDFSDKLSDVNRFEDSTLGEFVTFHGNSFSIRYLPKYNDSVTSKIEFTLALSIDPNYEGDIYLSAEGTGIAADIDLEPVLIATATKPISVSTKTTLIDVGYQSIKVENITITENFAGILKRGEYLYLELTDYYNNAGFVFAPVTDKQITINSGDILVSSVNKSSGRIQLVIDKESREASSFTLSNLEVKVNRSVPYGDYDLLVYGDSVFANYAYSSYVTPPTIANNDKNPLVGIGYFDQGITIADYVSVITPGLTTTEKDVIPSINSKITIYPGSTTVYIDGNPNLVDPAPINDNGTLYIPLRFFSEALGLKVAWDAITATGTITSDDKTIVVTSGQSLMLVDGVPVTMTDINGSPVAPKIVNDKILIPIRAFFNGALGLSQDSIKWVDNYYATIN